MMTAFLVLTSIVTGPAGPMAVTVKLPWSDLEHCQMYLKTPEIIETDWGAIQLLQGNATCEPRRQADERPA